MTSVLIAAESWASSAVAAAADATRAVKAGADVLLIAATRGRRPATLPFEPSDFGPADPPSAAAQADALYVPAPALTDLPFLARAGETGRALWLDTAMSTQAEVEEALACLVGARARVTLVHGVATAPARADELNLLAIRTLRETFALPVGFRAADAPPAACAAAVACGATLLIVPVDGEAASLPSVVADARCVAEALGDGLKRPQTSEWALRDRRQVSLVARVAIPRGAVLTPDMLTTAPPGLGLKPRALDAVVGRRAAVDIPGGTLLTPGMVE